MNRYCERRQHLRAAFEGQDNPRAFGAASFFKGELPPSRTRRQFFYSFGARGRGSLSHNKTNEQKLR